MDSTQDSDLASFFGDFSQSKNLSKIEPSLVSLQSNWLKIVKICKQFLSESWSNIDTFFSDSPLMAVK